MIYTIYWNENANALQCSVVKYIRKSELPEWYKNKFSNEIIQANEIFETEELLRHIDFNCITQAFTVSNCRDDGADFLCQYKIVMSEDTRTFWTVPLKDQTKLDISLNGLPLYKLMITLASDDTSPFSTSGRSYDDVHWNAVNTNWGLEELLVITSKAPKSEVISLCIKYLSPLLSGKAFWSAALSKYIVIQAQVNFLLSDTPNGNDLLSLMSLKAQYPNRHFYTTVDKLWQKARESEQRQPFTEMLFRHAVNEQTDTKEREKQRKLLSIHLTSNEWLHYCFYIGIDPYVATPDCLLHVVTLNLVRKCTSRLLKLLKAKTLTLLNDIMQGDILPIGTQGGKKYPAVRMLTNNLKSLVGRDFKVLMNIHAIIFYQMLTIDNLHNLARSDLARRGVTLSDVRLTAQLLSYVYFTLTDKSFELPQLQTQHEGIEIFRKSCYKVFPDMASPIFFCLSVMGKLS